MRFHALRLLALASVLCSASAVSAQEHATDRGSLILGGSAGVASHRTADVRSTYMHLNPAIQYFVRPGLAIGGTVNLTHVRLGERTSTNYGAGPQISYYMGDGAETLRPYVSAQTMISGASGGRSGVLTYGANAGVLYLFTRSVGLDASIFYRGLSFTGSDAETVSEAVGVAVGFSAFAF